MYVAAFDKQSSPNNIGNILFVTFGRLLIDIVAAPLPPKVKQNR